MSDMGHTLYFPKDFKEDSTVKPVLRDHCHEGPPVLKDDIFLAEDPIFQCN